MKKIKIDYDDMAMTIIEKVNEAIEPYNIYFESDETEHDGFEIYELKEKKNGRVI